MRLCLCVLGESWSPGRDIVRESHHEWSNSWRHSASPADRLFGLWPVNVGRNQAKPAYHVGPRVIPYYNFHLLLEGKVRFRAGETRQAYGPETQQAFVPASRAVLELNPGDLFFLFPYVVHEYWADPNDPPSMTWVGFDGPAASSLVEQLGLTREKPFLRDLPVRRFVPHLRQLEPTFGAAATGRSLRPIEYLARFLGEILHIATTPATTSRTTWLERARTLMEAHCLDGVTVQEIADQVGVDRSHLSKAFTREFGVSPTAHLRQARLERAQTLLRETQLSVTEVALSVGYGDVYAFSHAYRRHFGVAPSFSRT